MRLHQIRNATIILEYANKRILIDPMFAPKCVYESVVDRNWPFHDLPINTKDLVKNIDAVIITHLHIDHFDKYAQNILPKGIKIFVQDIYDKNALDKEHFDNIQIINTDGTEFEGINLFKTECMHGIRTTAEPIFLANGMRWESMGVIFKSAVEPTLYIAGDTIWFDGIKEAIDSYNPKYIVVNAACVQTLQSGRINMGVEDIRDLHAYYPEGKIFASHMDCVENTTLSRADLKLSEINEYIYPLADGEIILLD